MDAYWIIDRSFFYFLSLSFSAVPDIAVTVYATRVLNTHTHTQFVSYFRHTLTVCDCQCFFVRMGRWNFMKSFSLFRHNHRDKWTLNWNNKKKTEHAAENKFLMKYRFTMMQSSVYLTTKSSIIPTYIASISHQITTTKKNRGENYIESLMDWIFFSFGYVPVIFCHKYRISCKIIFHAEWERENKYI